MTTTVTKLFEFEAAHHLPNYDGVCKNLHGHSYKLEVEVSGFIEEITGMIMDFKELKEIVNKYVVNVFDHSNLNDHFENPTAEIMVKWIFEKLEPIIENPREVKIRGGVRKFRGKELIRIRLWETSTSYAEVKAT